MLKAHPLLRHGIEHRRLVGGAPIGTHALVAEVVCHNEDDVGLCSEDRRKQARQESEQEKSYHVGKVTDKTSGASLAEIHPIPQSIRKTKTSRYYPRDFGGGTPSPSSLQRGLRKILLSVNS